MDRTLNDYIKKDLGRKIVLLSGPHQSGKTTLSKMVSTDYDYLNFDASDDRLAILAKRWDRHKELLILDELHKLKNWKGWLKGIYDTEGLSPSILVTGSSRLDTYSKVGDSLAGRYFLFHLHPFDLKELAEVNRALETEPVLELLLQVGGFPQPFLQGSRDYYNRWEKTHLDIILRQDLIELESIKELTLVETLIQLMRGRVASPISHASLGRDLQCRDKSVARWLRLLESLYVVFKLTPYHRNIGRSLLKAPKYYFFDSGQVAGDRAVKLENLVAAALLKEIQFRQDCLGQEWSLHYLRSKDKREVYFALLREGEVKYLIEVKWAESDVAPNLAYFGGFFPQASRLQLVKELRREQTLPDGTEIRRADKWLADLDL